MINVNNYSSPPIYFSIEFMQAPFKSLKKEKYFIAKKLHDFFFFLYLNVDFNDNIQTIYKLKKTYKNKHDETYKKDWRYDGYDITFWWNLRSGVKTLSINQTLSKYLRLESDEIQKHTNGTTLYLYKWDLWFNNMNWWKGFKLAKKSSNYGLLFLVCFEITCRYWKAMFGVKPKEIANALQHIEELEQKDDTAMFDFIKWMWISSYDDHAADIESLNIKWSRKYGSKRNTKYRIHSEKINESRSIIFPLTQCIKLGKSINKYTLSKQWRPWKNNIVFWSKEICWYWKTKAINIFNKKYSTWILINYDSLCEDFPDASITYISNYKSLKKELNRKTSNKEFPRLINSVIKVFINRLISQRDIVWEEFIQPLYELCYYLSKDHHKQLLFNYLSWYKWTQIEYEYASTIFDSELQWRIYIEKVEPKRLIAIFLHWSKNRFLEALNIDTKNILM